MAEDDEVTFNMNGPPPTGPEGYIPLRFVTTPPDAYLVRRIAQRLLNTIGTREESISFWQSAGELTVTWLDEAGKDRTSKATFQRLVDHLVQRRTFDATEVDLPRQVSWLDQGVAISQPFQGPATNAPGALTIGVKANLGDDFPLTPWLDREGIAFSSVQLNLLEAVYAVRQGLVERAPTFFNLDDTQWLRDLHSYLGLAITLVDATLMQIYYKAKYDPLVAGLTFDRKRLGGTRNRRLFDKLQWVYATTGRPLDDAEHEIASLRRLRAVRNHLSHFDPPLFACTIEDAADWLNRTGDVARLLWKIRDKLRIPLCEPLIRLLLAPAVEPIPRDPRKRRPAQPKHAGYASSTWPSEEMRTLQISRFVRTWGRLCRRIAAFFNALAQRSGQSD